MFLSEQLSNGVQGKHGSNADFLKQVFFWILTEKEDEVKENDI